jgi:hypothetical protein
MADPKKKPEPKRFDKDALDELCAGLQPIIGLLLDRCGSSTAEDVAKTINLMVLGAQRMAEPVESDDG